MKKLLSTLLVLTFIFVGQIFSAELVNAQAEVTDPNLIEYSPEQLAELNNMPSVEVSNFFVSEDIYSSGEEVLGTVTLKNDRAYNIPDLKYKVSLVGNYSKDGLASVIYDSKFFGPVFLKAGEAKEVSFSYILPTNVAGKGLGIQIQFYTAAGIPLAWADSLIEVTGTNSILKVTDAYLAVGEQKYNLQVGPTLSLTKKGVLNVKVENPFAAEQILTPDIKIYDRTISGELLDSLKLASFTVPAKSSKVFQWEISYLDKAGVYEISADFLNASNTKIVPTILTRYIVSGSVATIQQVVLDKNTLKSGESYSAKITYSGIPNDIDKGPLDQKNILNLTVSIYNEQTKLVSSYNGKLDFNQGITLSLPLAASISAQKIFLDIKVTDDNGNIITTYTNEVTGNILAEEATTDTSNGSLYIIGLSLLMIVFIIIGLVLRKRQSVVKIMIFLAIFFSYSLLSINSASANSIVWTFGWAWMLRTSITLSTPNSTLSPGEHFKITGQMASYACSNSYQGVIIKRSEIFPASTPTPPKPTAEKYDIRNGQIGTDYGYVYNKLSLSDDGQDFVAPTTPGVYYINLDVTVLWNSDGGNNTAALNKGYIKITVVEPLPAPVISATTSASCGTKIRLAWDAVPGASNYRVYKNGVLRGTTASLFFEIIAKATDKFVVQSYDASLGRYSAFSNSVSARPSVVCPTCFDRIQNGTETGVDCGGTCAKACIPVSCTASPTATTTGATVTWTATATGGTGSYTYVWEGDEFVNGKTGAVVSGIYSTSTPSVKRATTTVTSGTGTNTETNTVGCSNEVIISDIDPGLTASCTATSDNNFIAPSNVTWAVEADGGTAPYVYSWDGFGADNDTWTDEGSDLVTKLYSVPGVYFANVAITDSADPAQSVTVGCTEENVEEGGDDGVTVFPPGPPVCTFLYTRWSDCVNGTHSRTVSGTEPLGCIGGSPELTESCTLSVSSPCTLTMTSPGSSDDIIMNSTYTTWAASSTIPCIGCQKTWIEVGSSGSNLIPPSYSFSSDRYLLNNYPFGSSGDKRIVVQISDPDNASYTTCTASSTVHVYASQEEANREH